jgi:hypothetical protein
METKTWMAGTSPAMTWWETRAALYWPPQNAGWNW